MQLHRLKRIKEEAMSSYITTFLLGSLLMLVIFLLTHLVQPAPIAMGTVNVTKIVEQFIKQESKKSVPQEILKKEVTQFGIALDREIKSFSKEKNVVLLLHEAVLANARDYTEAIKNRMKLQVTKREIENVI